jgi:hypothetical protein
MRALLSLLVFACVSLPCHAVTGTYEPVVSMHVDVARRVGAGQLDGLLQDADRLQDSQERFPDGRWKLPVFYRGLSNGFAEHASTESDWTRYQADVTALIARHPASSNAWLMLAVLHDSHAWAVRGGGYSNTVSAAAHARFRALLEQSREVLNRHKAALSSNPHWYVLRLDVGGSAGDDEAELDAVFEEGVRKTPSYQQIWFTRLHFLTPKWGGSIEQMVDFISRVPRHPAGADGIGMVARLLWFEDADGYPNLVSQPGLDWAVVKKSYDDILDRYPAGLVAGLSILQACGRSDKAETLHLLARIKTPPTPAELGADAVLYKQCTDWANGRIPGFILREGGKDREIH